MPSRPDGRCALRLPPGESPAGYPRRAQLGAPQNRRTGCVGSARNPQPQRPWSQLPNAWGMVSILGVVPIEP